MILYSSGHLGSATIFNKLLDSAEFDVIGLVKSQPLEFSATGAKKIRKHLNKVGWRFGWLLFWQQIVQAFAYLIGLLIPYQKDQILPAWSLAKKHNIPVHDCLSVNDAASLQFISDLQPDLIISAYFNQIIKPPLIALPEFGILNVHPGWLPVYRGAMAYFWVLKNGHESAGVSVHWIDEGIDTGSLVERRSFVIKQGMTQQRVLSITSIIGARLLKRVGRKLLSGQEPETISVDQEHVSYYPLPGSADFDEYFKTKRFFRIRDLISTILRIKY